MIPKFNLHTIKRTIEIKRSNLYSTNLRAIPILSGSPIQEKEIENVGDDFTIFIPVSMPTFQTTEQRLSRQLEMDLRYGAPRIQGVKKNRKTIKSQMETLYSRFTPGLPMLPKGLMHKWGFVAGVKNNPRTRVVPLGIPKDWNMIVSKVSYLITGFASMNYWGIVSNLKPSPDISNRKVTLLDNSQLMLLKVNPIGLNPKEAFSDLLEMMEYASMGRPLVYFPLGIIYKEKYIPKVIFIQPSKDPIEILRDVRIEFLNPRDLPDQPQANNINFSKFARDWNKE